MHQPNSTATCRCIPGSGKYRGQQAIEVRLDGQRVGELTYLMSTRYGAMVSQVVAEGGRPGCEALIQRGVRGLEVLLRLPREHTGVLPLPQPATPRRANTFTAHRPAWIAAAVLAVLLIGAVATTTSNTKNASSPATSRPTISLDTSSSAPTSTTTPAPVTTTEPTTTQPTTPPPPAEVAPPARPPVVQPPAPKPVTKTQTPPPAPPKPQPQPKCDPNYTGCVPVASDVDCLGGSGNGPAYVAGPIQVIGSDIYGLDADHDGIACEK